MSDDSTTVAQLRLLVAAFVEERQWHGYHDAKNLSMSIAIEAAELMEHFQWTRSEELTPLTRDAAVRVGVVEELADILCYALALANVLEIDLSSAVQAKMEQNAVKYPAETFRGRYFKQA